MDVARHVAGWSSDATAEYYSQTDKVMNSDIVASSLAFSTAHDSNRGSPLASVLPQTFSQNNEMGDLSLAFP